MDVEGRSPAEHDDSCPLKHSNYIYFLTDVLNQQCLCREIVELCWTLNKTRVNPLCSYIMSAAGFLTFIC